MLDPRAKEAIQVHLKIDDFINHHQDAIFDKIEERYEKLKHDKDAPLLFIGELLPLMSGIVQVASKYENINNGVAWAKGIIPNADAGSLLTTFTLLYLIDKGQQKFANDSKRHLVWDEISRQVEKQLGSD
jgi:hypothetical protein